MSLPTQIPFHNVLQVDPPLLPMDTLGPKNVSILQIKCGHTIKPLPGTQQFPIILKTLTPLEQVPHRLPLLNLPLSSLHIIPIADTPNRLLFINKKLILRLHLVQRQLVLVSLLRWVHLYVLCALFLFLELATTDALWVELPVDWLKALCLLGEDTTLYCNLVYSWEEICTVDVWVLVLLRFVLVQEQLLIAVLFIFQRVLYLFHINDAIDLLSCQLAQPVFLVGFYHLLVHLQFAPVLRQVIALYPFLYWKALVSERLCVDCQLVERFLYWKAHCQMISR